MGLRALIGSVVAAALLACATPGWAHDALRRMGGACVLPIGPDLMYFSGYQPAASRRRFCGDIPATGQTIFVLDYAQPEMREMSADFRIIRDTGAQEDPSALQAATVAYLPPKVYPNGTLHFEHVFPETGDFVGIVTLSGPHGERWVSRFPFSVGRLYSARTPYYLLAVAGVLGLLLALSAAREEAPDGGGER